MKAFVVTSMTGGEGGFFVGVYSTRDKADKAVEACEANQKEKGWGSGVWWEVKEVEVDGPPDFDA